MKLMIVSPGFLFARCKYLYRIDTLKILSAVRLLKKVAQLRMRPIEINQIEQEVRANRLVHVMTFC